MEIFDKQLKALIETFSGIQHYQRIVESNTKKLVSDLSKAKQSFDGLDPELKDLFGSSVNAFYFYSPYTGAATPYDAKKTSVDEAIELTFLHKNKQYQWLLAEAYEAYEDYLEAIYACAGYVDPTFWPAKDLDAQAPSSAKALGLQWFLDKSRSKKGAPGTILGHFRKEFPNLSALERTNKIGVDLRLSVSLIEKMRHIVVHKNGKTDVREQVIESVLKSASLLNNKKLEPLARARVNEHFGVGKYEGLVVLVEKSIFQSGGISMHVNRHEHLVGEMLAHASILHNELVARFGASDT